MTAFPAKIDYATGDVLSAAQMVDVGNLLNLAKTGILLETKSLTSGNTSVFSAIDQTYKSLRLVVRNCQPNSADRLALILGGGNHSYMATYATGSAPTVVSTYASVGAGAASGLISFGSMRAAAGAHELVIDFPDYADGSAAGIAKFFNHYLDSFNYEENVDGSVTTDQVAAMTAFTLKWNNGTSTFASGTALLYGI